jgi:hypothetical protein
MNTQEDEASPPLVGEAQFNPYQTNHGGMKLHPSTRNKPSIPLRHGAKFQHRRQDDSQDQGADNPTSTQTTNIIFLNINNNHFPNVRTAARKPAGKTTHNFYTKVDRGQPTFFAQGERDYYQ